MQVPRIGPTRVPVGKLPGAELRLEISIDGQSYRCTRGGPWTPFAGPRLIESARFLQRTDVTELVFSDKQGAKLSVETRLETAAWPDRRGLILAARPGLQVIPSGDSTIEHVILPIRADDDYGPDNNLRRALNWKANSWQMIHRQAKGNQRNVKVTTGRLTGLFPAIQIPCHPNPLPSKSPAENGKAAFTFSGGLGYVPVTIHDLTSHSGYNLTIDGKSLDQNVHGNDFWQTDFDPNSKRWSRTYNVPCPEQGQRSPLIFTSKRNMTKPPRAVVPATHFSTDRAP